MSRNITATPTDFKAFSKQREAIQREANTIIAAKIVLIEKMLEEIAEISEATGVAVSMYSIREAAANINQQSNSGWNSSSDNC